MSGCDADAAGQAAEGLTAARCEPEDKREVVNKTMAVWIHIGLCPCNEFGSV